MSAHDRAAKARARMDQVRREMAERRALRTRKARAAKDRAVESLVKQGPVAAQVAKHLGELGRRRAQAGGWATEKTERDRDYIMGFGGEDEEPRQQFAFRPSPPRVETRPGGIGAIEDEAPPPTPEPPPAPTPPPARQVQPPPRRPVRQREELDDEDDFSNQSTWMRRK